MNTELKNLKCFPDMKLYLAGFVSIFVHLILFYQVTTVLNSSSIEKLLGKKGGLETATEVSFFPNLGNATKQSRSPRLSPLDLRTKTPSSEKSAPEVKTSSGPEESSKGIGQGGTSIQYASILHAYLDSAKVFPRSLKELGLSGVVKVRFQVTPEGRLDEIRVLESEAPRLLQQEAMKFLQKLEKVPVPPSHYTSQQLQFELPLRYELKS